MDEKKQIQKEFFEEFVETGKRSHPKGLFRPKLKRTVNLSYEHFVFIIIAFIIACVVFFSLGVEKGKRAAMKEASLLLKKTGQEMPVPKIEVAKIDIKPLVEEELVPQPVEITEKEKLRSAYTVQVASYFKKATAEKEAEQLKKKGFKPFVLKSDKYYVVCVGEFKNKRTARSQQRRLRKTYPDCYIKRR